MRYMEQLSLFDEPITSEISNTEAPAIKTEEVVISAPIIQEEVIEKVTEEITTVEFVEEETFEVGDTVKIKVPQDKDSEFYLYLKHYYPHVMNKTGFIQHIEKASSGRMICDVNIHGTVLPIATEELKKMY